MTERKEPTLNAIRPEPDEIARRQRSAKAGASQQPPKAVRQAPPPARGGSGVAVFALLVGLMGCGGAGYLYWQGELLKVELQQADMRIVELEKQLEMTGDESTASMAAVQAKLKWADSEIRKLWGVAYDTNRKAIAANSDKIAVLTKGAGAVDAKISKALGGTKADIKLVNDLLEAQQSALSSLENSAAQQRGEVQKMTDAVRQMEKAEAELKRRIATNEEAIAAIDAFRRSVNQQLLQMRSASGTP